KAKITAAKCANFISIPNHDQSQDLSCSITAGKLQLVVCISWRFGLLGGPAWHSLPPLDRGGGMSWKRSLNSIARGFGIHVSRSGSVERLQNEVSVLSDQLMAAKQELGGVRNQK